jgi:hypothetical protein
MRRRREWFEHIHLFMALWWVPEGHIPTVEEAELRLARLREHGPAPFAFTFKQRFPAPHAAGLEPVADWERLRCPA